MLVRFRGWAARYVQFLLLLCASPCLFSSFLCHPGTPGRCCSTFFAMPCVPCRNLRRIPFPLDSPLLGGFPRIHRTSLAFHKLFMCVPTLGIYSTTSFQGCGYRALLQIALLQ